MWQKIKALVKPYLTKKNVVKVLGGAVAAALALIGIDDPQTASTVTAGIAGLVLFLVNPEAAKAAPEAGETAVTVEP